MTRRRRPSIERQLYLASRAAGDYSAARRGRLGRRLVRRAEHRAIWRVLRWMGL